MAASIADKSTIIAKTCPPLDVTLVEQLIDEYRALERRYVLGDWEPATLDGGQFAEIAARIIYSQDANNVNHRRSVSDCLTYVEDRDHKRQHSYPDRKSALHSCLVVRAMYKFRSARGAVHIDPEYTANQLDSRFVLENARWLLAELLRVFWTGDLAVVARAVQAIVRFEVPAVLELGGQMLLQRTDCTTEEEVLLLLYHAGETGLNRYDLGQAVPKSPSSVTKALGRLRDARMRQVLRTAEDRYVLTDLGVQRVLNQLGEKLLPK